MALYYADSSALIKLIRAEPQSASLRGFLEDAELVSCELVLTELPRAIIRLADHDPTAAIDELMLRAEELLNNLALRPLDRGLLTRAGVLAEPSLRALDAIHVAAAVDLAPHDGFLSYDVRQSASARLNGLRTFMP